MKLLLSVALYAQRTLAEMGCSPGNELYDGQCYYFSTDEVFKPDAKAFCWAREESQLLLISDAAKNAFFAQKVAEKGLKSVWLKINDKKDEGTWVVDRTGYSKPTSWADQTFLAFNQIVENTEEYNSCVLDETELWTIKDKFATSQFVCEGSLVELPENKSRERGGLVPVPNPSDNLQCWTCDATSVSECHFQGTLETCQDNEESCQYEQRKRKGVVTQIKTGCKATDSCENNKKQNFIGKWNFTQCRPESTQAHSVCRQCCDTDNCTKSYPENPTRKQWRNDM